MRLRTKLLVAFALVLLAGLVANFLLVAPWLRQRIVDQSVDKAVTLAHLLAAGSEFADRLPARAEQMIGEQMIVEATLAAHLVDVAENNAHMTPVEIKARLTDVAGRTVLDEFWITDDKGHAYLRNVEEIDFTFPATPAGGNQAYEFHRLLESDRGEVVQKAMPRTHDGRVFKYVGVGGIGERRIVQVGYEADSLAALTSGMTVEDLARTLVGKADVLRLCVAAADGKVLVDVAAGGSADPVGEMSDPRLTAAMKEALEKGAAVPVSMGGELAVVAPFAGENSRGLLLAWFDTAGTRSIVARTLGFMALTTLGLLAIGCLVALRLSRGIARPIQELAAEAEEIGRGNLDRCVLVRSRGEVGTLAASFNRMAASLCQHMEDLRAATAAKERLESEVRIAAELQAAMLPKRAPRVAGFGIHAATEPARVVGGDFYDFHEDPGGRLGFAIGDVSGKGLPAALFASHSLSMLRTLATERISVADILNRTNTVMFDSSGGRGMFVTLCYGSFLPGERSVAFGNAGHPDPLLVRVGRGVEPLALEHSLPLGVAPDAQAIEHRVQLEPGDLVVLYTDGVTDATNAAGDFFGAGRLVDCLERHRGSGPEGIIRGVFSTVRSFESEARRSDDVTLLVLGVS